ncbi:MAG: cysteine desulfurase family protein [Acidobacteriota bacterium]
MAERIYLDWNALHPLRREAAAAMAAVAGPGPANPSSVHAEGRAARRILALAREQVAAFVGTAADSVIFTSGGTEANLAGMWGLLAHDGRLAGKRLLVSAVEHPGVMAAAEHLGRFGVVVRTVPVDTNGAVDIDALLRLLDEGRGAVVCIQLANSETGVVQPLERIAAAVTAAGARLHCDMVQAAGKLPLRFAEWGIASAAIAGQKIGAPAGIGAWLLAGDGMVATLIPGTQERHLRGGTENVIGAAGFGAAAEVAAAELGRWAALEGPRDALEEGVLRACEGTAVYGRGGTRLPNTSCLGLPAPVRGPVAVAALDLAGLAVSSGSACSSGMERVSRVVEAMGYGPQAAARTVRISLGPATPAEVVARVPAELARVVRAAMGQAG